MFLNPVSGPEGTRWSATALAWGGVVRTLDLYPAVQEFLHGVHVRCDAGALAPGDSVRISLKTCPDGFRGWGISERKLAVGGAGRGRGN
jgi:hypothetical protein